jgi:hypothetical protein
MARRRGEPAAKALKQEKWNHWRVLIRRPEFQKDIRALRRSYRETGELKKPPVDLWSKWGVSFSYHILTDPSLPALSPLTVDDYQPLFAEASLPDPISTYDLYDGPYDEWQPPPGIKRGQILVIEADLGIPVTSLLPAIEEAIKTAQKERPNGTGRGYLSADRKRSRHSNLTFQLRVYDLYMNGEPVRRIAQSVSKAPGTIKSALRAAIKLILGDRPKTGRAWITRHLLKCSICRQDESSSFDCPEMEKFLMGTVHAMEQDQKTSLPPISVKGEKSAFAKWDAKHPSRRR